MNTFERPGVNQKWLREMKRWKLPKGWPESLASEIESLTYYAQHGYIPRMRDKEYYAAPPTMNWTHYMDCVLRGCMGARMLMFDHEGLSAKTFDVGLARSAFAAVYLAIMIELHREASAHFNDIPFTALGIVLGCKEQGLLLARLQLKCVPQFFVPREAFLKLYPPDEDPGMEDMYDEYEGKLVFHFMLRLMADYLNQPPHLPPGDTPEEGIFRELLALWRDPDPEKLVPACLAACDYHTHRCQVEDKHEFWYDFRFMPVEILLLFRLRQYLGLANPVLDHPIMNSAFGVLPEEGPCEDEVIRRVRERMVRDGFDQAAIVAKYLPESGGRQL